jgi:hypothetical protein
MMVRSLDEPFPIKPETADYEVLRVLVTDYEDGATPAEIAANTELSTSRAAESLGALSKSALINHENGVYYVNPDQADRLKRRLESVDAVEQLFDSTPDDVYGEPGWDDQVSSISMEDDSDTVESRASRTTEEDAEVLVAEIEEENSTD